MRALRHPNYRLFFGGQLISVIGTFLTNTAMGWLASTLTNDPHRKALFISLVLFASQIPLFVLGPIGGVWVDRLNRRKLLVGTQTLSMLQCFALAALSLTHRINLAWALGLALVQGLINAIDIPGRQAFVVDMVTDRQDLANAIVLNSRWCMRPADRTGGGGIADPLGRNGLLFSAGWVQLSGGDRGAAGDAD